MNSAVPFAVDTYNQASSVTVTVPSDVCRLVIGDIDDRLARPMIAESLFVSAMTGLINGAIESDADLNDLWLRDVCCDLLEAMVNPRYASPAGTRWGSSWAARQFLLDAVRRVIRNRLHANEFGIAEAAAICRVSVRHLQAVLKSFDTTFRGELLEARLQHAARLLRSPTRGSKQVGEIASACGFQSHAHFSTSYKERFGVAPRDEPPAETGE